MFQNKGWQETCWVDESGKYRITISEVLDLLKDEPVVNIRVKDLSHIKDLSLCSYRVTGADLSCPIIVTEEDGRYTSILDGHHRRSKALRLKRSFICAKILRICCIPVQFHWLAS